MFSISKCCIFACLTLILCIIHQNDGAPNFKKERTKLPSFIKICHRNDPQLNVCARNSLNSIKDRFVNGIPELYVPPLEPLIIPEVKMDQDSGAIFLHSTYKNIYVYGLSNFTLNELNVDTTKLNFTMALSFPKISMSADYMIDGKIMMMPLAGDGLCRANFTDVKLDLIIMGQKIKKAERYFIKVKDIKMKYTLGNANLHFGNLFNGDAALGERMNKFLNENWEALSDEVRPLMENAMSEVVRSSTDKLFSKYSYDDLLPE